jgi:hypothetical protein
MHKSIQGKLQNLDETNKNNKLSDIPGSWIRRLEIIEVSVFFHFGIYSEFNPNQNPRKLFCGHKLNLKSI